MRNVWKFLHKPTTNWWNHKGRADELLDTWRKKPPFSVWGKPGVVCWSIPDKGYFRIREGEQCLQNRLQNSVSPLCKIRLVRPTEHNGCSINAYCMEYSFQSAILSITVGDLASLETLLSITAMQWVLNRRFHTNFFVNAEGLSLFFS